VGSIGFKSKVKNVYCFTVKCKIYSKIVKGIKEVVKSCKI